MELKLKKKKKEFKSSDPTNYLKRSYHKLYRFLGINRNAFVRV
jgi:hypothetical protein